MPISGGQVTPTGAGGSDFFVSADMQRAQISEGAHLIENKTGRTIDQDILIQLRDDYLEMLQRFGLDGVQGFGSALRAFAERLNTNPADLRSAFRTDMGEHLFANPAPTSGEQSVSGLISGYTDLAAVFTRSGRNDLAAQAYRAVAVLASISPRDLEAGVVSLHVNELNLFEQLREIYNLVSSNISSQQQYGEKLLAAALFDVGDEVPISGFFMDATRSARRTSEDIAYWTDVIRAEIRNTFHVPDMDPTLRNVYVQWAQRQIHDFSIRAGFSRDLPSNHAIPLHILIDRGGNGLVRDFTETNSPLQHTSFSSNVGALLDITAAQENLTPERVALTRSVLHLIRAAAPVSAVKLRYYIVPLAITYLATNAPNGPVDLNLAKLLNIFLSPVVELSENEAEGKVEEFLNIVDADDIASASDLDSLVYDFLDNLVRHWDPAHTEAARLLDLALTRKLNGARIVLISAALYEDKMRGTDEFSQRTWDKYTEILFDPDPAVQDLIDKARLSSGDTLVQDEVLFDRYEEIKRSRRGQGSGGTSGAAPEGSPEGGEAGSGGDVEGASSVDWAEEITAAYDGYEYEIEGAEADADDWGDEQIDVADAEYYDWDIDVAPLETGGMSVYAEAFPL